MQEVRSKKIAELNVYKSQNAERKVQDIQQLLKLIPLLPQLLRFKQLSPQ